MVIRLVLQIAEGECTGREFVLVGRCFACDECTLQIGILPDQEIKAALSYEDAGLVSGAPIVGVDRSFVEGASDVGLGEGAGGGLYGFFIRSRGLGFCHVDIPGDAKTCRGILLLIGLFLLEGLDVEVPADSCGDLVSLHLAPADVRILARGEAEAAFGGKEGRGDR